MWFAQSTISRMLTIVTAEIHYVDGGRTAGH